MKDNILISKATENNWKKLNVKPDDLKLRLTKRANKRYSTKTFLPLEYIENKNSLSLLEKLSELNHDINLNIFLLSLKLLSLYGLISLSNSGYHTDNPHLKKILNDFEPKNLKNFSIDFPVEDFMNEKDFLGIAYQSLLSEGNKNLKGSYYTPEKIIKNVFPQDMSADKKFLDPCCGTGSFLLKAADFIDNPNNIYGYDIDKTACFISKINLIIKFKNKIFNPNIFNLDFLSENSSAKFDYIITNPPWGALTKESYKKDFPQIKSGESFSYFIIKCSKHIKSDGIMTFILPESILNVKAHKDIRQFILNNFHIKNIALFGKAFSKVLSDVISITLDETSNSDITIFDKEKTFKLNQNFYKKNSNCNFSILGDYDIKILEKIYSRPHQTLKNSTWALGIVTGNNQKHISTNPQNGEKIYSGKNILKNEITETDFYINYTPEKFQQSAPDCIYRANEKLVYKFISKKLVFAFDTKKRLFLNSANILIPKLEGITITQALALLNSQLFQYIYTKKFNELKILKGNLSNLPFPLAISAKILTEDEIFKLYNLDEDEIKYIKSHF